MTPDPPLDPFADDPDDPVAELAALDDDEDETPVPLTADERTEVLADLSDLEGFQALLEPRGVRGLVVDCTSCEDAHYFGWEILRANLHHLLDHGESRVHEPAFSPEPSQYVSWDYARGYMDAVMDADE